jgi:hypothetical protein
MSLKYTVILCLISAITAASLTKYYFPNVQTKTQDVTHDVIHTQVQTVTKTVKLPSGEVDTTVTTDKDIQNTLNDIKTQVSLQTPPPNWLVSATYNTDIHTLQPSYGADVKRRILGPVFLGINADTSGRFGASLGMEF